MTRIDARRPFGSHDLASHKYLRETTGIKLFLVRRFFKLSDVQSRT